MERKCLHTQKNKRRILFMVINNKANEMNREALLASIWTITVQLFDSVTPQIAMLQFSSMSTADLQKVYNGLEQFAMCQYTRALIGE